MKASSPIQTIAASSAERKEKAASGACFYMTPQCLSLSVNARFESL